MYIDGSLVTGYQRHGVTDSSLTQIRGVLQFSIFTNVFLQFCGAQQIGLPLSSMFSSWAQWITYFNLTHNSAHFLILLNLWFLLFNLTQSAIALSPQVSTSWIGVLCCMRKMISSSFLRVVGRAKLKVLLSVWTSLANLTCSMQPYRPSSVHVCFGMGWKLQW